MDQKPLALRARGISKAFGGTLALDNVSLDIVSGTIHALIGQNGAGKSTLVKIMTGAHGDSFLGVITVAGRRAVFRNLRVKHDFSIGYVPQEINVVDDISLTENVFVGHLPGRFLFSRRRADAECAAILRQLGLSIPPRTLAAGLSASQRQLLMVARALALKPAVLILDEPTTSLADAEAAALGDIVLDLAKAGLGILYVTHRVQEVLRISNTVTVLRDGKVVDRLQRSGMTSQKIINAMAGRDVKNLFPGRVLSPGPAVMTVAGLSTRRRGSGAPVHNVSFSLHRGEVLGIAGLLGSGRSELLEAIYGATSRTGKVDINGFVVRPGHPRYSRRLGLGMLSEDRKRKGLLFNLNMLQNITIGALGRVSIGGVVRSSLERVAGEKANSELQIKTPSLDSSVEHLSGGNQQKVLIARALLPEPKILLLDEPTKGIDVGTRQQIYELIAGLTLQGLSLVIVSSELDELLGLCDRYLVLAAGEVVDEFAKGEGDENRILSAIAQSDPVLGAI